MRRSKLVLLSVLSVLSAPGCGRGPAPGAQAASQVDTTALAAFADSVGRGAFGNVDGLLVVHDGATVFTRTFPRRNDSLYPMTEPAGPFNYHDPDWHPFYHGTTLHTLQSVTKSITSIVFGIALAHGDLSSIDQPIAPLFPEHARLFSDPRKRAITIRHLLTMTSGIRWPEGGTYDVAEDLTAKMEKSKDWVSVVLEQPMEAAPGEVWTYSSGATALLAAVFRRITGQDIQDYAGEHLFKPLDITFQWKRSAGGLTDTEGGLYLGLADLAKIGQLCLDQGAWHGQSIVPADWVKESVAPLPPHAVDRRDAKWDYGRLWWLPKPGVLHDRSAFFARGYGGQYLMVLPATRTVAVITQWNIDSTRVTPEDLARRVERAVIPAGQ